MEPLPIAVAIGCEIEGLHSECSGVLVDVLNLYCNRGLLSLGRIHVLWRDFLSAMSAVVDVFGNVGQLAVMLRNGNETGQTGLHIESSHVKRVVRGEGADGRVIPILIVLGAPVVEQVFLKERRGLPEVVDVRQCLDDGAKRSASRCRRVRGDDVLDARRHVREVVAEFDTRSAVFRRV